MESKLTAIEMQRHAYDETSQAVRSKLVDTSFSIELDHQDGDSVTSHKPKLFISALEVQNEEVVIPEQACSHISKFSLYINPKSTFSGKISVLVSPTLNDSFFVEHSVFNVNSLEKSAMIVNSVGILAQRVKVVVSECSPEVVFDLHLVGQG
jgi:hypothetical protein